MNNYSTEDLKSLEIVQNKIKDISSHFGTYQNKLVVVKDTFTKKFITREVFNHFLLKCIECGYNLYKTMEKEVKICPPEGYEIDVENSTLELIKFKPKVIKFRDNKDVICEGFYVSNLSVIVLFSGHINTDDHYNVFATEKQAKSALAYARLSQIIANDSRFGGPITDKEWSNVNVCKWCIRRSKCMIIVDRSKISYYFLAFHTFDQAELFMKENMDLIKDYYCIE